MCAEAWEVIAGSTDCSGTLCMLACRGTITLMEFADEYAGRGFVRTCAHSYRNI